MDRSWRCRRAAVALIDEERDGLAPEQTGIGIRRHFTTEGTSPLRRVVEWERRDARITNYRTARWPSSSSTSRCPSRWSLNATNILAQKYFRGHARHARAGDVAAPGRSTGWSTPSPSGASKDGYFVDDDEAEAFSAELKHLIVTQKAAFNSPVWFNIGVKGVPQQASACFILSRRRHDGLDPQLVRRGGHDLQGRLGLGHQPVPHPLVESSSSRAAARPRARSASCGAPTPRPAPSSAGGKTRRAAKMVILNVDHPDIEDFIWCKALEERKARVLRDAGFDMDLDGRDSHSIQYQNANNSVRVTDEFMQAVVDDADWDLRAVTTGEVVKTIKARDLMRQIAEAAWECADPGMQFDTTINHWHTAANTGRINGSNPCSEYMHLDNSACNLASLNLLTLPRRRTATFDVEGFRPPSRSSSPPRRSSSATPTTRPRRSARPSRRFRQLGLGYANLGALLMALGLPYDSDEGRAWAAAITALMTGHAYATSARTAARMGPFAGYTENAEHMLRVLAHAPRRGGAHRRRLRPDHRAGGGAGGVGRGRELGEPRACATPRRRCWRPTGCLVGGTLVAAERGPGAAARRWATPKAPQWQPLERRRS